MIKLRDNLWAVLFSFGVGLVGGVCNSGFAQEAEETPPAVGRTLTGTADLGDLGRFVGVIPLGTVEVSSNLLTPDVDGNLPNAQDVTISNNGFAWTSSGLVLRNVSGSDFVFSGSNPDPQSHELEVYYFGDRGPTSIFPSVGDFSIENFNLSSDPVNSVANDEGNTVQSFGGFWEQSAVYRNTNGDQVSVEQNRGGNPFPETGVIDVSGEFSSLNRTTTSTPSLFPEEQRPILEAPSFRDPEASLLLQRTDALFQVTSPEGVELDLSGIDISVSGQSVSDRFIRGGVVDLGRFIRDDSTETISSTDSVELSTSGTDATRTRLNLGAFDVGDAGEVQATLETSTDFNSADSTATVELSGTFEIDLNDIGTFFEGHDVFDRITSLENLQGENLQSRLRVGYEYGVVDNNDVTSRDVTVFKLDDYDTTGTRITNQTVEEEFDTDTHTNLRIDRSVTLDNSAVQTVTLSEGNGITGEGLTGENVIAETTFDVHTLQVATSQLVANEGEVLEGGEITIENTRSATGLDATAYLTRSSRQGSDRWFFPASGGGSIGVDAGETVSLTPTFDETGLDDEVTEGELGRNFRTRFSVTFQDGLDVFTAISETVPDSSRLASQNNNRFGVFGSIETRQSFNWVVERAIEAEAEMGALTLAAGVSLRDEGLNLTNTLDNTAEGFQQQTSVEFLDGIISQGGGTIVNVTFESLEDAFQEELNAVGFDDLASDIARIEGLDGVQHTLQLNYNFDQEFTLADASLLWLDEGDLEDPEDGAWVNAILGNSDIESYDLENDLVTLANAAEAISLSDFLDSRQFALSYTDYLLSLDGGVAELGAFGFDEVTGVVWAVIDHNSSFASTAIAVPEPSTNILLLASAFACCGRRRR